MIGRLDRSCRIWHIWQVDSANKKWGVGKWRMGDVREGEQIFLDDNFIDMAGLLSNWNLI